jgi:hypothetical protein
MHSLPTRAIWVFLVLFVLLSPVIAMFLAIAGEIVLGALVDAGAPGFALLGAGVCALILVRRLWRGRRQPVLET